MIETQARIPSILKCSTTSVVSLLLRRGRFADQRKSGALKFGQPVNREKDQLFMRSTAQDCTLIMNLMAKSTNVVSMNLDYLLEHMSDESINPKAKSILKKVNRVKVLTIFYLCTGNNLKKLTDKSESRSVALRQQHLQKRSIRVQKCLGDLVYVHG